MHHHLLSINTMATDSRPGPASHVAFTSNDTSYDMLLRMCKELLQYDIILVHHPMVVDWVVRVLEWAHSGFTLESEARAFLDEAGALSMPVASAAAMFAAMIAPSATNAPTVSSCE